MDFDVFIKLATIFYVALGSLACVVLVLAVLTDLVGSVVYSRKWMRVLDRTQDAIGFSLFFLVLIAVVGGVFFTGVAGFFLTTHLMYLF